MEPLENKPNVGKPEVSGAFESSFCNPAANIISESKTSIPPMISTIFLLSITMLPTIPNNPPIATKASATQPNQISIVIVIENPIADTVT